jgi:hypothetical protein
MRVRRVGHCVHSVKMLTGALVPLVILATSVALGQTKSNGGGTTPGAVDTGYTLAAHRFELGASMAASPAGRISAGDDSLKIFAGLSGTYALLPRLAFGAEVEQLFAPQNDSHDCYGCVRTGTQVRALVELRTPLGTEAVRLFGRLAAGPAFVTGTDEKPSVLAGARVSIGADFRVWHLYVRPFGYLGTMTRVALQFGLGFETGATF